MLDSGIYICIGSREPPKTTEAAALQIMLQVMLLIRIFAGYHVLYDSLNSVQYRLIMAGR
jgi:hypothetical protein